MSRSIDENVDVIRRGYDRIYRVGPDGARDFMDPDIVLEMPEGVLDAGTYHGREATMRVWHAYADEFEESRWEVEHLIGVEDRVFLRVRERGRGRQSGAEVVRAQFCLDESTALEAVAISKLRSSAPPSRG
jgi:ketosteroid isomerase-like protein